MGSNREGINMNRIDEIKIVCKKCHYYKNICHYDYGDSMTKIPCEALRILMKIELMLQGVDV